MKTNRLTKPTLEVSDKITKVIEKIRKDAKQELPYMMVQKGEKK